MTVLAHAVAHGISHTGSTVGGQLEKYRMFNWLGKGFTGLSHAGYFGITAALSYYSFAHDYGTGFAAAYSVASYYPITGIPLAIMGGLYDQANDMYKTQRAKRTSSFAKAQINDTFGTINKMRQYSHQQLLQDHSSKQRVLGNEAAYFAMRAR